MWINHSWNVKSDSDALLIPKAPEMLDMLEKWALLNPDHYKELAGFIYKTEQLIKEATEI